MASLQKPDLVISGLDTDIKVSIVVNIHRASRFLNPVCLSFFQDAQQCVYPYIFASKCSRKEYQITSCLEDTGEACCMACWPSSC